MADTRRLSESSHTNSSSSNSQFQIGKVLHWGSNCCLHDRGSFSMQKMLSTSLARRHSFRKVSKWSWNVDGKVRQGSNLEHKTSLGISPVLVRSTSIYISGFATTICAHVVAPPEAAPLEYSLRVRSSTSHDTGLPYVVEAVVLQHG